MPTSRPASPLLLGLLGLVVAASGCYQAIGVREVHPKAPPPLVDGQDIEATDQIVRRDSFHINNSGDIVQNKSRLGDASYGGEKLTIAQAAAMAHPEAWREVVSKANNLRASCRRGILPEVIATIATFAVTGFGIAVASSHGESDAEFSTREQLGVYAMYGSAAGAVVSYAIGYAIGGHACKDLAQLRVDNHLDDDSTDFVGKEVELINKLARDFNTRRRAPAADPAELPPEGSGSE